ncbi:MAG: 2-phosphosulfolactate phosphatase [Chloroflexota bacterium]
MIINRATNETCHDATGTVVVVDVMRAFTTAAYAFHAGASEILLVSSVDEAFALKATYPEALIMGEVRGLPPEGFDFGNSPLPFETLELNGRRLIQRTSNGTQGMVRSQNADLLLAGGFPTAGATARYIQQQAISPVTFVITGLSERTDGDEDAAYADYVEALLREESPDPQPYLNRVRDSWPGRLFANPDKPDYPSIDLDYATTVDAFDFVMAVEKKDELLIMKRVEY